MSSPFVGEIRLFAGNFAPLNWAFCNGQLLSIAQNPVLFQLIGTTYGGDGINTFAVPDLRGRAPIHFSGGFPIGSLVGSENVTLTNANLPAHSHTARGAGVSNAAGPVGNYWSADSGGNVAAYHKVPPPPNTQMSNSALSSAGGNQPHENMQPFLTITYIISLEGIFPTQS